MSWTIVDQIEVESEVEDDRQHKGIMLESSVEMKYWKSTI